VSESESKNVAQPEEASEIVVSTQDNLSTKTSSATNNNAPGEKSVGLSAAVAWLALLLVIVLAGGAVWVLREGQSREAGLVERVAELETGTQQKQANLDELSDRWQQQLNAGLDGLKTSLKGQAATVSRDLQSVQAQLAEQQKELARFSASDRESWLLAEAGHLLRLANQRLVMAGDPVAAQALLNGADSVLRDLNDPNLHAVRAAVAADIAALRAVPEVDVEGIYLRLAALTEQADKLVIFQFKEKGASPRQEAAPDWRGRLRQGYEAALTKLSDYIIIRRRDVPMQALMDPQWEGLVRQNLRMLLEQAQIALLAGNQRLYAASLTQAQQWVVHFRDADTAAANAISTQITKLKGLTIQVPQPNISRSQQALDKAIEQRAQSGGEQ
jgi:uroporphyrin-3 C-methyltransferase|tara:strand:- start:11778 stop:12938 length:1161 start_codon:yes stop_codon:yes gene_type:complete